MKKLSSKEKLFCEAYAECQNAREAAYKAGWTVCPELAARRLMMKEYIRAYAHSCMARREITLSQVRAGLGRIAFASSADAVRLLLSESGELDAESLDLFNIAEIKRPKTGGLEIKFFDRIKALEKLGELSRGSKDGEDASSFYKALEMSAGGAADGV